MESLLHKKTLTEKIRNLDISLIIITLIIGIISCFAMYSTDGGKFAYHTISHIYRFSIFYLMFVLISFIHISFWKRISTFLYLFFLVLLICVEFFGLTASGSKRWISLFFLNLQPSELIKVGIILFLAKYYNRISYTEVNRLKYLGLPVLILIIPVYFVVRQPDLGTAILIFLIGGIMMWLAGLKIKYFSYVFLTFIFTAPFAIYFLKPYQKLRILTFLNPERDPLGAGYQIIQSKIAIGSGGIFGKGFLNGSQSYLDYLPEKHTDFIFTLFSEEFGFVGSFLLIVLYMAMIFLISNVGKRCKSSFGKFYCFGFASTIFLHFIVNMAMVLGLLPTVGSPLPIMSYGGSSMLSVMLGLGIVLSCNNYDAKT